MLSTNRAGYGQTWLNEGNLKNASDAMQAKFQSAGYLYIHVAEKNHHPKAANNAEGKETHVRSNVSKVEVKVPMKVVDALLSAGKDELDIVAALHALSSYGDTELVSVKDDDNTVRVWIDSKNISE